MTGTRMKTGFGEPEQVLPPPPPEGARQRVMSPERQMWLRIWTLEDTVESLSADNAQLQSSLAKMSVRNAELEALVETP